jgi:mono/diheme cytochrome c family protein
VRFASIALIATAGWLASVAVGVLGAQAPPARASQGVYTKAQAGRGSRTYAEVCVDCHSLGRFRGVDFAGKWADKPLSTLYTAVKSMPKDEPGTLDPQEYADLVAYLLSINEYPEGPQELAVANETLAAILLDGRSQ